MMGSAKVLHMEELRKGGELSVGTGFTDLLFNLGVSFDPFCGGAKDFGGATFPASEYFSRLGK